MTTAGLSLAALLIAIIVSMTSRMNVGLLAIAVAWLIGTYSAGLKPDETLSGFPASLFITLTGVALLFAIADTNGTLQRLGHGAVALIRGGERSVPILLFVVACALSAVGPGAVSCVAMLVPIALVIGERAQIPPLMTVLMVANGGNAGNLSPLSAVGIIANSRMEVAGIVNEEPKVMAANFLAHVVVAAAAYGYYLWWRRARKSAAAPAEVPAGPAPAADPLTRTQIITSAVIAVWIVGVAIFNLSVGPSAYAASALLLILRAGDERAAIQRIPWGIILMVSGVSILIALLERTGGMELFSALLAKLATPDTVNGMIALLTGAISAWSSTSGVVLPAFLPTIPALVEHLGGGVPLAIALSINVGASIVDVSPLSTIGALCVAAVKDPTVARRLFSQLMVWGFAMSVVGAVLCQLFAGPLAAF